MITNYFGFKLDLILEGKSDRIRCAPVNGIILPGAINSSWVVTDFRLLKGEIVKIKSGGLRDLFRLYFKNFEMPPVPKSIKEPQYRNILKRAGE